MLLLTLMYRLKSHSVVLTRLKFPVQSPAAMKNTFVHPEQKNSITAMKYVIEHFFHK